MAASSLSRLYLIPIAVLILGIFNALFAYSSYETSADQQLLDQFRSDANIRILIGDAILKRYQTKTRSALATLDNNSLLAGSGAGGSERLISIALSAADLISADTPFATVVLRRHRDSGDIFPVVLPPRFCAVTGRELSADPMLSAVDWSSTTTEIATLVAQEDWLDSSRFVLQGAAVLSYRVLDRSSAVWQYIALSIVELESLQRAIDRELAVLGPPPALNIVAFDISTENCLLAYAVNGSDFDCPDATPSSTLVAITELYGVRVFVLPSKEYLVLAQADKRTFPYRELFWGLFVLMGALTAVVLFLRNQARNEEEVTIERNLVLSQQRVTGAVHRQVSEALAHFSSFAETLRDVADEEDQRYVDIAVTDIVRTRLELDTTVLTGGAPPSLMQSDDNRASLSKLVARSSAYLTALTKDGEVVTRLLADDGLPETIWVNSYWLESLVFALIQSASDSTDLGFIEVAFWAERAESDNVVLFIRTRDTGVSAELDHDTASSPDKALRLLAGFLGAEISQKTDPGDNGFERIVKVTSIA